MLQNAIYFENTQPNKSDKTGASSTQTVIFVAVLPLRRFDTT